MQHAFKKKAWKRLFFPPFSLCSSLFLEQKTWAMGISPTSRPSAGCWGATSMRLCGTPLGWWRQPGGAPPSRPGPPDGLCRHVGSQRTWEGERRHRNTSCPVPHCFWGGGILTPAALGGHPPSLPIPPPLPKYPQSPTVPSGHRFTHSG